MTTKGFPSRQAENREVVDTGSDGRFSVPDTVLEFVVGLANPEPGERLLAVGLYPQRLVPFIDKEVKIHFVTARTLPERHRIADANLYDVIICVPYVGITSSATDEPNEEVWVKWSIEHLEQGGRLAIIVPVGLPPIPSQESIRSVVADNLYFRVNFSRMS